jgi:uncharacterized membrane protein
MHRMLRWLQSFWYRPRLIVAMMFGALLFAVLAPRVGAASGLLLAFDLACVGYLAAIGWMMATSRPAAALRRAERHRDGHWTVLLLSLLLSAVVLLALHLALRAGTHAQRPDLLLAGASIVLSWLFFGVVFAQAYAHADLLARRGAAPALLFPGSRAPDYWDYLYFSLILSMTFQTSDVSIADHRLRRVVLLHSVVAFFFNVFIIAQTVNAIGANL